jgi:hypothetical protein
MTRRVALALALALTTAVTFAVVALGAQIGYFGFNGGNGTSQAEVLPETSAARTVEVPTPTVEPTVITEYIYLDQTTPAQNSGFTVSRDGRRDDDDDDEYEWEWEREDERGHEHEHEHGHDD